MPQSFLTARRDYSNCFSPKEIDAYAGWLFSFEHGEPLAHFIKTLKDCDRFRGKEVDDMDLLFRKHLGILSHKPANKPPSICLTGCEHCCGNFKEEIAWRIERYSRFRNKVIDIIGIREGEELISQRKKFILNHPGVPEAYNLRSILEEMVASKTISKERETLAKEHLRECDYCSLYLNLAGPARNAFIDY